MWNWLKNAGLILGGFAAVAVAVTFVPAIAVVAGVTLKGIVGAAGSIVAYEGVRGLVVGSDASNECDKNLEKEHKKIKDEDILKKMDGLQFRPEAEDANQFSDDEEENAQKVRFREVIRHQKREIVDLKIVQNNIVNEANREQLFKEFASSSDDEEANNGNRPGN